MFFKEKGYNSDESRVDCADDRMLSLWSKYRAAIECIGDPGNSEEKQTSGMIYTKLTKTALRIAFNVQKEQAERSGLPYIVHSYFLAEQMENEDEVIVALLHDVVNDGGMTLDDLRSYGFSASALEALALLPNDDELEYTHIIEKLKSNAIAKKVKLAELRYFTQKGIRGKMLMSLLYKYEIALARINKQFSGYDRVGKSSDGMTVVGINTGNNCEMGHNR